MGKKSKKKPRGVSGRIGRPRKTGKCEVCGANALFCTGSHRREHVRTRNYTCKACGDKTQKLYNLCPAGQEGQLLHGYPTEIAVRKVDSRSKKCPTICTQGL